MPWRHRSPGHQQPWYWLWGIKCNCLSANEVTLKHIRLHKLCAYFLGCTICAILYHSRAAGWGNLGPLSAPQVWLAPHPPQASPLGWGAGGEPSMKSPFLKSPLTHWLLGDAKVNLRVYSLRIHYHYYVRKYFNKVENRSTKKKSKSFQNDGEDYMLIRLPVKIKCLGKVGFGWWKKWGRLSCLCG